MTDIDIRTWLPGTHNEHCALTIPSNLPAGTYQLCLAIGGNDAPSVKLATKLECRADMHILSEIKVM